MRLLLQRGIDVWSDGNWYLAKDYFHLVQAEDFSTA